MRVDALINIECIYFIIRIVWSSIATMAKYPNRFIRMLLRTHLWIILPKGMMQIILKNYRDFWQNVVSSYYFKVVVIDSKSFFFLLHRMWSSSDKYSLTISEGMLFWFTCYLYELLHFCSTLVNQTNSFLVYWLK